MAAARLSMASGTCPALALPVLRLTSAMMSRGDVVGTPLLLWMAFTNVPELMSLAPCPEGISRHAQSVKHSNK